MLLIPHHAGAGRQDRGNDLDSLLRAAQAARAAQQYDAAQAAYAKAVAIRPDLPELWANLGLMQHETGAYSEAFASFQQANRLDPKLYVPNLFLGIESLRDKKNALAISYLLKAEKLQPMDAEVYRELGQAYYSGGQFNRAIDAYRRVLELKGDDSSIWFELGLAYLARIEANGRSLAAQHPDSAYAQALFAESLGSQGRWKEASKVYARIVDAKMQPPCLYAEYGFALLREGEIKRAEEQFSQQGRAQGGCLLTKLGRARSAIDGNAYRDAIEELGDLWATDSKYVRIHLQRVTEGLKPEERQAMEQALSAKDSAGALPTGLDELLMAAFAGEETAPPIADSRAATLERKHGPLTAAEEHRAREEYATGHYTNCVEELNGNIAMERASALELLATCSYFVADYQWTSDAAAALDRLEPGSVIASYWGLQADEKLAFAALGNFRRLEPDSSRSHVLQGDIYREQHRYGDAQSEYRRGLEISAEDPAALMGLALAYWGDADVDKTIRTALVALKKNPADPELNLLMGEALVTLHRYAEAGPYLEKSLGGKPQTIAHVHALLGEVELLGGVELPGKSDSIESAIRDLKLGLASDEDGSVHYQLAQAYRRAGDPKNAALAAAGMKEIEQRRRKRAAEAVDNSEESGTNQKE